MSTPGLTSFATPQGGRGALGAALRTPGLRR